jgi:hypothetical protein
MLRAARLFFRNLPCALVCNADCVGCSVPTESLTLPCVRPPVALHVSPYEDMMQTC